MKLRRILEKVEAASGFTSEEKGVIMSLCIFFLVLIHVQVILPMCTNIDFFVDLILYVINLKMPSIMIKNY